MQNEQLYLILLDDACRPVQDLRIAEGVPNRVAVDTCRKLRAVARTNSTCGILAQPSHRVGHPLRSRPPDDLPHYGGHRPARHDHGSYHHSGEDGCSMLNRGSLPEYRANSGVLQAASR